MPAHAGQLLVQDRRGACEVRHHEIVEVEPCLAHQRTQCVCAPQPAKARGGEGAHAHNLRGGVGGRRCGVEPGCYALVAKILVCREANGELRIFAFSCAAVILVPPFGRRNQSLAPSVAPGNASITPMRHCRSSRPVCPAPTVEWQGVTTVRTSADDRVVSGSIGKGRLWCRPWLRPETGRRCGRVRPEKFSACERAGGDRSVTPPVLS